MQATPLPQADTPATRWGLVMSGLLTVGVSFGLIDAAQVYLRSSMLGRSYSWSMALLDAMPNWILLALLAPAVIAMAGTCRLDRPPREEVFGCCTSRSVSAWTVRRPGCP